jgi:DUF3078 family protein
MKKALLLTTLTLLIAGFASAQKDTTAAKPPKRKPLDFLNGTGYYNRDSTWKIGGFVGLTVSQTALYQWAPGGTNSFSFLAAASGYANYKKKNVEWSNNLDIKYGEVANGLIRDAGLASRNFQKNIDVLQLATNIGYQVKKELYISVKASFLSQFSRSYDYSQTDTTQGRFRKYTVSKFGAPAIMTLGLGLTYKPKDWFTLFFSPAEGKLTYVTPDDPGRDTTGQYLGTAYLTNKYFSDVDETRFGLKTGTSVMAQFGAELDILFQKDIVKNVNWKSHLNVFESYTNNNYNTLMPYLYAAQDSMGTISISKKTQYIPTVTWDNDLVFKINKILSATLSTRFVYQYNAITPVDKYHNSNGAKGPDGLTDVDKNGVSVTTYNKLQIFEQFGIGLAMKF